METISTMATLASGAYTFYKIHPYVPYRMIWNYASSYIKKRNKKEIEMDCYEVISEDKDTRYLLFRGDGETVISYSEPVWL